jgi:hypothetical protein
VREDLYGCTINWHRVLTAKLIEKGKDFLEAKLATIDSQVCAEEGKEREGEEEMREGGMNNGQMDEWTDGCCYLSYKLFALRIINMYINIRHI